MIINDIIFYRTEINGEKINKAVIFLDNGNVGHATFEQGIEYVLRYAKQQGYTTMEELKHDQHIQSWSNKTVEENMQQMIQFHQKKKKKKNLNNKSKGNSSETFNNNDSRLKRKKRKSKKTSIFSKISSFFSKRKNRKWARKQKKQKTKKKTRFFKVLRQKLIKPFIGLLIGLGILTGGKWVKNDISKKQAEIEKELENNQNTENNNTNFEHIYEALYKANMNQSKKDAITSIWNYISHYNQTVAKNHLSKKSNTKLGLRLKEIEASYIAYNNFSPETVYKIFDSYHLDSESMLKAYKTAHQQEVLAHTVQKEALGKEELIKSEKGKNFYLKYEDILIHYNSASNDSIKLNYAEQFYKNLKNDFNFETNNIEKVKNYKLSIMPMIEAMNRMTNKLDLAHKLTKQQKKYFERLSSEEVLKDKFTEIEKQVSSYTQATKALGEQSNEVSYQELRKLAIQELKEQKAYNVSNTANRDIKDHKEYKENINYQTESSSKSAKTTNSNTDSNSTKTTKDNKNTTTPQKTKRVEKNSATNKDEKKTTKAKGTPPQTEQSSANEPKEDDYYYIASDTPENNENNGSEQINDSESVKDTTTDSSGAVDEKEALPDANQGTEYQNPDSLIIITYSSPNKTNQTVHQDNNDSLISVTYNSLDETMQQQTIESNEAIATQIVDEMASQTYIDDSTPKTYTR